MTDDAPSRLPPEFDGAERMRAWQPIDGVWLVHVRLREVAGAGTLRCAAALVAETLPNGEARTVLAPILTPAERAALGSAPESWAIEYAWYPPADAGGEWTERRFAMPRRPGDGRGE